jgi:hypothetical protein
MLRDPLVQLALPLLALLAHGHEHESAFGRLLARDSQVQLDSDAKTHLVLALPL